jgi:hypothetical protein
VRTPTGLTPLTDVELAASTHAPGPLFYGIYTTPPTEIVVERADGSIIYTETSPPRPPKKQNSAKATQNRGITPSTRAPPLACPAVATAKLGFNLFLTRFAEQAL